MKNHFFVSALLVIAACGSFASNCMESRKTIIVDLCVKPNVVAGAKGLWALSWSELWGLVRHPSKVRELQDALLKKLDGMPADSPKDILGYYQGKPVPPIMQDYIVGKEPDCGMQAAVEDYLDCMGAEKLYKVAASFIFSPKCVATVLEPDQDVIEYMNDIKGKDPRAVFILASNWNASVFESLKTSGKFDEYLSFFKADDGTLRTYISGDIKIAKPDREFYDTLVKSSYHVNLAQTTVIEAEFEHAVAAKKAGFAHVVRYDADAKKDKFTEIALS